MDEERGYTFRGQQPGVANYRRKAVRSQSQGGVLTRVRCTERKRVRINMEESFDCAIFSSENLFYTHTHQHQGVEQRLVLRENGVTLGWRQPVVRNRGTSFQLQSLVVCGPPLSTTRTAITTPPLLILILPLLLLLVGQVYVESYYQERPIYRTHPRVHPKLLLTQPTHALPPLRCSPVNRFALPLYMGCR